MNKHWFIFFLFAGCASVFAKELSVGGGRPFSTIHQAIAAADSGDVIKVSDGIYKEGEILITKPISLQGTKGTIVDGENKTAIFIIHSSHVTIEGFTIQNGGVSDIHEPAGIRIENADWCVIKNNHLINTFFAIYLANASHCIILNNRIKGNAQKETSSGNGIHLWKSSDNTITGNHISGHRDGIYFEFVKNSFISHNLSEHNLRYGLHFMFSDNDSYEHNIFHFNGSGVAVMYSKNVTMVDNLFENNWGAASYGLLLKEINHSEIMHNRFIKNTIGIYMEGTGKSSLHHNSFKSNGWALKIWGDCADDTVRLNNFQGNTFDVATNATTNYNLIESNYWDHYTGYDLNHDAVGDVPFHPVSLYSKLAEESPFILMLLHSVLVDILDQTEKMLPAITPEQFRDDKPLMKPLKLIDNGQLTAIKTNINSQLK